MKKWAKAKNIEVLFGINPIMEALKAGRRKFYSIIIKKGSDKNRQLTAIATLAKQRHIPVESADIERIANLADAEGHQGIVANVSPAPYSNFDKIIERIAKKPDATIALLDGVQDPRNLGAALRSAEAFGVDALIIPDRRAATYTPVAAKASAGAGEHLPICRVTNIAQTIVALRELGFFCVALEADANEKLGTLPNGPVAIVLGGEGTGVRPLVKKRCDTTNRIATGGKTGSLNISAAAAIVFYASSQRAE